MKKLFVTTVILAVLLVGLTSTASATSGAVSTTDNPGYLDAGSYTDQACLNGPSHTTPEVNCNIYADKRDVWLSGLPVQASLGAGTYFFAVLDPGGQNNPNDGSAGNLSTSDTYVDRTFSVDGNGIISYSGPHQFDLTNNEIQLFPYADTSNPGGVYILAVCEYSSANPGSGVGAPGVNPSTCKYDAFKVGESQSPVGLPVTVSKDANGAFTDTYVWNIAKSVDNTEIDTSTSPVTFNYTVTVTHDGGTISAVNVSGTISVFNPNTDSSNNPLAVTGVNVTDQLSDGTVCNLTGGSNATLTTFQTDFPYSCDLSSVPQGELDNTVTVTWPDQTLSDGAPLAAGSASFTFANIAFTANNVDNCVNVTDSYAGALGQVCSTAPNPTTFQYQRSASGTPGTCTSYDNTATFTTNTTGTTGSASQTVKVCVGADLTVSKTATPSFKRTYNWNISKAVDKTLVEQLGGGTATFNYTVKVNETGFTDSEWQVNGVITVTNPNNWESVALTGASDVIDNGGLCTVGGNTTASIPASGSVQLPYTCAFPSNPGSGHNVAAVTWDASAAFTPHGSAQGGIAYDFANATITRVNQNITVTDTFNGSTVTLGTLTATDTTPYASATYNYSHTVNVPTFNCVTYNNTAKIVETGQSASASVKVCGPAKTGALTMGFWQNKNGQGIITGGASTGGVCNSGTWLRQYAPFQDLSATATCTQVATYVFNIIKAANASGASMNAMLKAQMLATSLDVYFSNPALGGNKINAPAPIGGVVIDLTKICHMIDSSSGGTCSGSFENVSSAFGGATSLSVSQMLAYAASQSNAGGSTWYGNVKATQGLAKDAFDAINNQVAFAP